MPVIREVPEDRTGPRRHLGAVGEGVGLLEQFALLARDGELVDVADSRRGHDDLPDARRTRGTAAGAGVVPDVEVADDADRTGVRRPDGEACAAVGERVATETPAEAAVRALVEPMHIVGGDGVGSGEIVDGLHPDRHAARSAVSSDNVSPNAWSDEKSSKVRRARRRQLSFESVPG